MPNIHAAASTAADWRAGHEPTPPVDMDQAAHGIDARGQQDLGGHVRLSADHVHAGQQDQQRPPAPRPTERHFDRQQDPGQPDDRERGEIRLPENEETGQRIAPGGQGRGPKTDLQYAAAEDVGPQAGDHGGQRLPPGQRNGRVEQVMDREERRESRPAVGHTCGLVRVPKGQPAAANLAAWRTAPPGPPDRRDR